MVEEADAAPLLVKRQAIVEEADAAPLLVKRQAVVEEADAVPISPSTSSASTASTLPRSSSPAASAIFSSPPPPSASPSSPTSTSASSSTWAARWKHHAGRRTGPIHAALLDHPCYIAPARRTPSLVSIHPGDFCGLNFCAPSAPCSRVAC